MIATIQPGCARGTVAAPPSKSMAHRLLICAGLSEGISRICGVDYNEDVLATIDCLRGLGATCTVSGDTVTVQGADVSSAKPNQALCCRESGSTLRFFIPLALLSPCDVLFTGTEKLLSRPLDVYSNLCAEWGLCFSQDKGSVKVRGVLCAGEYHVPGNISSQFITGLLFALPLVDGDSVIRIAPPFESRGYIDLTLQALQAFGIHVRWCDAYTLLIPGNQKYVSADVAVEGDYSGAAFFAGLNALGADITITGLSPDSLQGDKVYEEHLKRICAGRPVLDIADCPDLGPILFAVAAARNGAVFTGTRRLKIKESDRASAMAQELAAFGTDVIVEENRVVVTAKEFHPPVKPCSGHNDHRIVMSLAVLMTLTGGQIQGAQAVRKSFPDFFERLRDLGIEVSTYEADE